MAIQATSGFRAGGSAFSPNGRAAFLDPATEADLVSRGVARYVNRSALETPAAVPPTFARRHAAVIYGDSIALANWAGPQGVVPDATQNTLSARGYAVVANMLMGWPFEFVWNGGVSGNTTSQMLARANTDLLPYVTPGTVVFLNGGINDVGQDIGSDAIVANIGALCDLISAAGGIVSLGTIVPANYYVTGPTIAARNRVLQEANDGFRELARRNPNIYLSDDYAALVDGSQTYAAYLSAATYDNLHPNTNGAMQMARARVASLASLPRLAVPLLGSCSDYGNLLYNALAVGNNAGGAGGYVQGAGTTGNAPNGWSSFRSGTAAAVCSVISRADEVGGQWARMAVTGGALNNYVGWQWTLDSGVNWAAATAYPVGRIRRPTVANGFVYQVIVAGTTGASQPAWPLVPGETVVDGTVTWVCKKLPVPGDIIDASVEFALSGFSGPALAQMFVSFTGSAYQINSNLVFAGDTPPTYIPPTGRLRIPPTIVPDGATNVIVNVVCAAAAAVTGNFDIARPSARLLNR